MYSTLNCSRLLHSEIFYVAPCPKSPRSSGWLWTHQHMIFQSNTALRIQNYIVCDLLWTWYKCLTQAAPFISPPVLESLTTSKLTDLNGPRNCFNIGLRYEETPCKQFALRFLITPLVLAKNGNYWQEIAKFGLTEGSAAEKVYSADFAIVTWLTSQLEFLPH